MKIAILTSGLLPVPAVKGGAVENLLDSCMKYNHEHRLHDITVYSVWDEKIRGHEALLSDVNHYVYTVTKSLWAKACKNIHERVWGQGYYHRTIEYYLRKAWKSIRKEHYDIILLDNRPGYAVNIDVPTGTKLFIYLHNDLLNSHTKDCNEIYSKATRIFTVSDYIASCVRTINPADKKCFTILNGIDHDAFSPQGSTSINRSQLGLRADDFVMVFSGRVTKEKGVAELIEAMTRLKAYPDIKLLIIGSPFYGDTGNEDDFVRALKQQAEAIRERIIFTGFVPYKLMPEYLRLSDVATIPSLWDDPCPITVLEAQATGLPIITTRRGGIPEEVTSENAILLTTDEHFADCLTDAILELYNNKEKRMRMGKASLVNSKYYNQQRYAEDFFRGIAL